MPSFRRILRHLCLLLAMIGTAVAAPPSTSTTREARDAVQLTAYVPSAVFRRGEEPCHVVAEIKNNLLYPLRITDEPATRTLHEREAIRRVDDPYALNAEDVAKAHLTSEFIYTNATPARGFSRPVVRKPEVTTIAPGETRLVKLRLDLFGVRGKHPWRLAVRLGGERTGPALGVSQTLDVEVVDERLTR